MTAIPRARRTRACTPQATTIIHEMWCLPTAPTTGRHVRPPKDEHRDEEGSQRYANRFRLRRTMLYHVPYEQVPPPIAQLLAAPDAAHDPMRHRRITTTRDAQSLMVAESFYLASELQSEVARCRIRAHTPGFSEIGRVRAILSPQERQERQRRREPVPLDFYLGQDSRITL